jgi:valyl-tRNA synthetase
VAAVEAGVYGRRPGYCPARRLVRSPDHRRLARSTDLPADFAQAAANFERLRELVTSIRSQRAEYGVEPGRWVAATIAGGSRTAFLNDQRAILCALARLDDSTLVVAETAEPPPQSLTISLGDITAYLPLAGLVDLEQERERLNAELAEAESQIERLTKLLNGPFADKAPAAVVAKEREKLERFEAGAAQIRERLEML